MVRAGYIVAPAVLGLCIILVGALEGRSSSQPPAPFRVTDERKDLLPEDYLWYRRHERASTQCRGQQYVSQCCEDARTETTCVYATLKGKR